MITADIPQIADTPARIKERNEAWAKALDINEAKARRLMRDGDGRCCLAVAEDVAVELGYKGSRGGCICPHSDLGAFFGWFGFHGLRGRFVIPILKRPPARGKGENLASNLNDGVHLQDAARCARFADDGLTHKEIAECVRHTFCGSEEPWSFSFETVSGLPNTHSATA